MMRCYFCGIEIVHCPQNCSFFHWKHVDTMKHKCDNPPQAAFRRFVEYSYRNKFAWPDTRLVKEWQ